MLIFLTSWWIIVSFEYKSEMMKRFEIILALVLFILMVMHLVYSIDYSHLFTTANKAGATGAMICLLGLVSLWLSLRQEAGERPSARR